MTFIAATQILVLTAEAPAVTHNLEKRANCIIARFDSVTVRVTICNRSTVRVTAYNKEDFPGRQSLVVRSASSTVPWNLRYTDSSATVSTGGIRVRLSLATGSVTVFDGKNRLLVRGHPTRPHALATADVNGERAFHCFAQFILSPDEGIYGLGQFEYGDMNYRGKKITLIQNNRHVCVPLIVSSKGYGIYWDNYSHTEFQDGADGMTLWSEVGDAVDYYVIAGSTIDGVIMGFRDLSGRAPMFPRWALGYWQSKERYENQDQLMSVAREYRRRGIPIDAVVQDWQYWGKLGWNAMAFDPEIYPDPRGMIDSLHGLYKLHLMLSIWPQVDSVTQVYRELNASGHLYPTEIWNGGKTYDAYSPEARDIFWKHLNAGLYRLGVDAWWVDATEPDWKWSDSLLEEKEGIIRNGMTAIGSSTRYLNTYALMATEGIYEHQRAANPDRRVVMLTRSAFAGQQRNATAIWSGDISSTWLVYRNQIAAGLNFCMTGIPYWNSDIGGFLPKEYGGEYPKGPRDPAFRELYVRWFQFGAFSPLFRAHGTDFPREVWQFGEPGDWAYDALRSSIDLRYRLMPYLYSLAWTVTSNHGTMMRALPMDFPSDRNVLNNGVEYMFGPGLLVAPVTTPLYYQKSRREIIPPSVLRGPDDRAGLLASYFQGMKFDTLMRVGRDSCISFDWSSGAEGVGRTRFSVRWEGKIVAPETGAYEFEIVSDDGVNLWVDGRQLMDEMYPGGLQTNIGEIELQSGRWYNIRVEYFQEDKGAAIGLYWRTPSMLKRMPVDTTVREVPVYFPAGTKWWNFWTGRCLEGGQTVRCPAPIASIPLFARAGSIIPLGPLMQHATEKPCDPIDVRVYRGANGHLTLYEDVNDGYGYEHGLYATILITWDERRKALTFSERHGAYPGMLQRRTFHVFVVREGHGVGVETTGKPDAEVIYTGKRRVVTLPG